ncbi:MAG: archaeosortase/exosortase family protein [Puniceicoccaceae bacterium]
MSASPDNRAAARLRRPDFLCFAAAAAGTGAWLFATLPPPLGSADQIANTAILLAILALYLVFDFRPGFANPEEPATAAWFWAGGGLLLAGVSAFPAAGPVKTAVLFTGLGFFLRAGGGVLLDPAGRRLLNSLFFAFTLFGVLLVSLPFLDMPLRIFAGQWSARIFEWLHQQAELGFVVREGVPMLLLVVNGRPFHVAAECNGFGLLGTSLLLTVAFVFYRRVGWVDAVLLLIAAVFLALVGNLVRIFIIILLAPLVGDHYMLMHEIVGTISFYGFLAIQWWLVVGFGRSPAPRVEGA